MPDDLYVMFINSLSSIFRWLSSQGLGTVLGLKSHDLGWNTIEENNITHASKYAYFTENGEMSSEYLRDIRDVLCDFMREEDISYRNVTYDDDFARSCCSAALHNIRDPELVQSPGFKIALQAAVSIVTTIYAHLEDISTIQWICLYATYTIYFDDLAQTDPSSVREFYARFISGQPQMHPVLDSLAVLLRDAWNHFSPSSANLVVSSTLDFITSLIIDYDQQKMLVNEYANEYPRWVRTMMGDATAFIIFMFPPDIPLATYIQIIPTMVNYVNDVNDLFSFYKEEISHENTNHISLLAQLTNQSKLQCMKDLARYSVDASYRCQAVLSADPKALKIYTDCFVPGYVAFHATARRYKLDDLDLWQTSSISAI